MQTTETRGTETALNIAEGTSRYSLKDKVNFFRIAKGSIFECVAILDVVHRLKMTSANLEQFFKDLETAGRMLSELIRHLESRKSEGRKMGS
jgi:four helix bundle protein